MPDVQERTLRVLTVVDAFRLGGAETLIAQLGRVAALKDEWAKRDAKVSPSPGWIMS